MGEKGSNRLVAIVSAAHKQIMNGSIIVLAAFRQGGGRVGYVQL
jgi:hypothetical protein